MCKRDISACSRRGRLCVQTARRVPLGRWHFMMGLGVRGKTSVGETDVYWERAERERGGWRYTLGAHDLYKVTYIRHLKSMGLSVTMLTQKRIVFSLQKWEFSVKMGSFRGWHENSGCSNTKKEVFGWQMITITG